jgi:hypothetical protein
VKGGILVKQKSRAASRLLAARIRVQAKMRNKTLNSNELTEILSYLDTVLKRENLRLEIAVYGGAAIMLYYGADSRDMTEDIDSVIINRQEFGRHPDVFEEVAKKFGLAEDWINSNILNTLSELKREDLVNYGEFSNIEIKLPSKEQLLAMKIKSARYFPKNDFLDAKQIVADLGIKTLDELRAIVDEYIPQFLITSEVKRFMTALMEK